MLKPGGSYLRALRQVTGGAPEANSAQRGHVASRRPNAAVHVALCGVCGVLRAHGIAISP